MNFTKTVALLSMLAFSGVAFAETPAAPALAAPAAAAATPKAKAPMTAKAKECSAQADAKGLHGAERKKFRAACKKG
jgi:hypothetical protein